MSRFFSVCALTLVALLALGFPTMAAEINDVGPKVLEVAPAENGCDYLTADSLPEGYASVAAAFGDAAIGFEVNKDTRTLTARLPKIESSVKLEHFSDCGIDNSKFRPSIQLTDNPALQKLLRAPLVAWTAERYRRFTFKETHPTVAFRTIEAEVNLLP